MVDKYTQRNAFLRMAKPIQSIKLVPGSRPSSTPIVMTVGELEVGRRAKQALADAYHHWPTQLTNALRERSVRLLVEQMGQQSGRLPS